MRKLTPIRFERIIESGGSTKPWLVTAIDPESDLPEEVPYVVKLFTKKNIIQGNNIGKEFFCNVLASQFDLSVPEAALVDLHSPDFLATLDPEKQKVLSSKHQGITFASRLIEGSLVSEHMKDAPFDIQDCATLFAFDCMILNTDRGGWHNKANLLMNDGGFILIDHELSLNFIDSQDEGAYKVVNQHLQNNSWPDSHRKHLFYHKLRAYRGPKSTLFDTFEESLRNLNLNDVQSTISELNSQGVSLGQSQLLIDYLRNLKQNSARLRTILLGLIA